MKPPSMPAGGHDGLLEILQVLFDCGPGLLMTLQAYFDESYRGDIPSVPLCVGGYLFEQAAYSEFSAAWGRLLTSGGPQPVPYLHMTELYSNRSKLYGAWTLEERASFLGRAVQLIKQHMFAAVSAEFSVSKFLTAAPDWPNIYGSVYSAACQVCLMLAGQWANQRGGNERIAYVFERGHAFWWEANAILGATGRDSGRSQAYGYRSHTAMDKTDAYGLQAADILVWILTRKAAGLPNNNTMRAFRPVFVNFTKNDMQRYKQFELYGDDKIRKFIQQHASPTERVEIDPGVLPKRLRKG